MLEKKNLVCLYGFPGLCFFFFHFGFLNHQFSLFKNIRLIKALPLPWCETDNTQHVDQICWHNNSIDYLYNCILYIYHNNNRNWTLHFLKLYITRFRFYIYYIRFKDPFFSINFFDCLFLPIHSLPISIFNDLFLQLRHLYEFRRKRKGLTPLQNYVKHLLCILNDLRFSEHVSKYDWVVIPSYINDVV